ncbi:MAG TPA: hypothetical protein VD993_11865 [Chitinophagaceae bacterium]|nr:hypothetical protein [Chitinophagaceae bacterium]
MQRLDAGIDKILKEYTEDGLNPLRNKHLGNCMQLNSGEMGIKIRMGSKQPGGIFTKIGEVVIFWYR